MREEWSKPTLHCLEVSSTMKFWGGGHHGGGWKDKDDEDDIDQMS